MHPQNFSSIIDVLKIKPFRNLWFAQIFSQVAYNMLVFILGVVVYEQAKSNTAVSLLYLTVGLPAIFFGVFSGLAVDWLNKKYVLFISTIARILFSGAILAYVYQLPIVYLTMAAISFCTQLFIPAEAALIPQYVKKHSLISANALFTMTFYLSILGGFVAGGPLLSGLGTIKVLWFLMILFGISSIFILLLPQQLEINRPPKLNQIRFALTDVFKFIRQNKIIFQALLLLTMAQAIIAIFATLGPGFADRILLVKLTDASLVILGPAAIGMISGTIIIGTYGSRFPKRVLINAGILLSGIILTLIALFVRFRSSMQIVAFFEDIFSFSLTSGLLPVSLVGFFLLGFANALIDISCNTVLQEYTDDRMRGRVYGILGSLIGGVSVIPVLLSGILADALGTGKVIFSLGAGLLIFGIYTSSRKGQIDWKYPGMQKSD